MEHAQHSQASPWAQHISVEIFTEHKFLSLWQIQLYASTYFMVKSYLQWQNSLLWKQPEVGVWQQMLRPIAPVNFVCARLTVLAVNLVFSPLLESWHYMRVIASFKKWKGKQKARTFDSFQRRKNKSSKSSAEYSKTTKKMKRKP